MAWRHPLTPAFILAHETNSAAKESGKVRAGMSLTHVGHDGDDPQELGSMSTEEAGLLATSIVFVRCQALAPLASFTMTHSHVRLSVCRSLSLPWI